MPKETLDKLHDALNDIEAIFGHLCKIEIIQLDNYDSGPDVSLLTVGNENISVEIYDAINEYKDLECIIDGCNNKSYRNHPIRKLDNLLSEKYIDERFSSIYIDYDKKESIAKAGICNKCNKYKHDDYIDSDMKDSRINYLNTRWNMFDDKCQACGIIWTDYKYYKVYPNYSDLSISNSKKQVIAKFRLIRSESDKLCNINPLTIII